jgi:hypothetical protein
MLFVIGNNPILNKILINMKNQFITLFFLALTSIAAIAQASPDKDVAMAVENLHKAILDGDKVALENVVSADLSYGHSSGLVEDKVAFVDALASGKNDFKTIEITDQVIKMVGKDLAIVRHKFKAELTVNGTVVTPNIGILLIWQKQKGQWKLLARQAFKL